MLFSSSLFDKNNERQASKKRGGKKSVGVFLRESINGGISNGHLL